MKWKGRRRSSHVEDRRGQRVSGGLGGRGGARLGGLLVALLARGSAKTKLLVLGAVVVAMFVFKVNPLTLFGLDPGSEQPTVTRETAAPDDEMKAYLSTMKADNEDVWSRIFRKLGKTYKPAHLVIYNDKTVIPGGVADSRMGPFYMPANQTVYLDPRFFHEMKRRFGARGDFAQAYVLAHEVGHHVQNLLGYTERVHGRRGRVSEKEYNRLSVRLELHADFLAGVFAHHGDRQFRFLETGDIEEAMNCARAIGDDTLQRQAGRRVVPDSFTHGTAEQRSRWFMRGYRTGRLDKGDTFSIPYDRL